MDDRGVEKSGNGEVIRKSVPENICINGVPSSNVPQGREVHASGNFLVTPDGQIVAQYFWDKPTTNGRESRFFNLRIDEKPVSSEDNTPSAFCSLGENVVVISGSRASIKPREGETLKTFDIPEQFSHSDGHRGNLSDYKDEPLTPYKNLPEDPNLAVAGQGGKVFVNFSTQEPYYGDRGHIVELDPETGTVRNIEGASLCAYAICDQGKELIVSGRAANTDVIRIYDKESLQLTREVKVPQNRITELPVQFATLGDKTFFLSAGGQIRILKLGAGNRGGSQPDILDVSENIDTTKMLREMVGVRAAGKKLLAVGSTGDIFSFEPDRDFPLRKIPQRVGSVLGEKEKATWRVLEMQLQEKGDNVQVHCLVDDRIGLKTKTEVRTITRKI